MVSQLDASGSAKIPRMPVGAVEGRRVCVHCVIDDSDPNAEFDQHGVCRYCRSCDDFRRNHLLTGAAAQEAAARLVEHIKRRGRGRPYDCILGLSGGVDSSYLAVRAHGFGLRPLVVHVDSGWNSELAVANIERIVNTLKLDLYTYVCNWEEMRDLQLAFLKAGVVNCDIPQDHVFMAVLYRKAVEERIPVILSGENFASESVLPPAWRGHTNKDLAHILAIHRKHGRIKLKTYPRIGVFQRYLYYQVVRGVEKHCMLDLLDYNVDRARCELATKVGWRDYGSKHYESVFTRFFQGYYLIERFGYDKRKAHLSSLVNAGQRTREEALRELERPAYNAALLAQDKDFVLKKLGLSEEEFETLLRAPARDFRDFRTDAYKMKAIERLGQTRRALLQYLQG